MTELLRDTRGKTIKIAIDFDGVIHDYQTWEGIGRIPGDPIEGSKDGIRQLIESGYDVYIYSTRCDETIGREAIRGWLERHGFPEVNIWGEKEDQRKVVKPHFHVFIDDRGYRFEGNWADVVGWVLRNQVPSRWQIKRQPLEADRFLDDLVKHISKSDGPIHKQDLVDRINAYRSIHNGV